MDENDPNLFWQASYNGNIIDVSRYSCLYDLFDCATLCSNARFNGNGDVVGPPTEAALLLASQRLGVHDRRMNVKRIDETSFSSDRKYMEVRCLDSNKEVSYMKGKAQLNILYFLLLCSI